MSSENIPIFYFHLLSIIQKLAGQFLLRSQPYTHPVMELRLENPDTRNQLLNHWTRDPYHILQRTDSYILFYVFSCLYGIRTNLGETAVLRFRQAWGIKNLFLNDQKPQQRFMKTSLHLERSMFNLGFSRLFEAFRGIWEAYWTQTGLRFQYAWNFQTCQRPFFSSYLHDSHVLR